jgi:phosphatidylinositol glycan class C protein
MYASFVFAALSLLCSILHIVLFDYDVMCATHPKFSGTVSLNAAIFSSVLLASRLPAALHVFAFVCFAFEIFAGLPIVLALVRRASAPLHFAATAALCVLAARALAALRCVADESNPST